jgi:hypothetical protein
MHRRLAGLLFGVLAAGLLGPSVAQTPPPLPDDSFVVVKFDGGREEQLFRDAKNLPSLAERGYRVMAVPPSVSRERFMADLRATPGVVSVEADATVFAADYLPTDPLYASAQAAYLGPLGAPIAWDLATGRDSLIVAVLDSGLDVTHPEFAGRLWENTADANGNGIDDDGNGCVDDRYGCRFINVTQDRATSCGYTSSLATGAILDDHGKPGSATHSHGTLVSGIIGARGDNGVGVAGLAWSVRIMTVKVLDCGTASRGGQPSGDMANVAQAIDYARRNGANIINLSLASRPGDQSGDIGILRDAIAAAQAQGIIVVAAAGNHTPGDTQVGPGYPAAYTQFPNVIAVGSSDNNNGNTWANYSNYGPAVDFAAPGNDIASTVRTDLGLTTIYGLAERGTSFSTPLVTGMFLLMMSRNAHLTPAEYITVARSAATPPQPAPHGQNWAGSGVINIGAAVARIPFSITGNALHDWKDVPPNSEIRALVEGTVCGVTTTAPFGVVAKFALLVHSAAEQPGCGAPGKTVQLTINGASAVPTFPWSARNEDLGFEGKDVSSVSPAPAALVVQTLGTGWSNIAHLEQTGSPAAVLTYLPLPWSAARMWDPEADGFGAAGRYLRFGKGAPAYVNDLAAVKTYDAFWTDAAAANVASLNPEPPAGRKVTLKKGWNNFVYTGNSRSVTDALAEVSGKYSQVVQYDNASGTWLQYLPGQPRYLSDFGGLMKLKVYWVFMKEPGTITMN